MKTIGIFTDNELIVLRTAIDIINDYEKAGVTVTKQTLNLTYMLIFQTVQKLNG